MIGFLTLLAIGLSLPVAVFGARISPHAITDPSGSVPGYRGPIPFGHAAINAPLDEHGRDTYLGKQIVLFVHSTSADYILGFRLQVL